MTETAYVSRINQIDAAQLDNEIYKILKSQTREITKLCPPEKVEKWQPEIDVVLKLVIWYFSLGTSKSTFGQRLLDLNYAKLTKRKAFLFLVLDTVPGYIQNRFADRRRIVDSDRSARLRTCIEATANIVHLLSFINLLIFLHRGRQPSVVERILGIFSETATKHKPRRIGYSYMTRELLWHGLMELFSVGLPMINFHYVKQTLVRMWMKRTRSSKGRVARPTMNFNTRCPYCNETPILPSHADCEHVYCYYCLNAHFAAINSFQCLTCGTDLHAENIQMYVPSSTHAAIPVVEEDLAQYNANDN